MRRIAAERASQCPLWVKSDIVRYQRDVRFTPKSGLAAGQIDVRFVPNSNFARVDRPPKK